MKSNSVVLGDMESGTRHVVNVDQTPGTGPGLGTHDVARLDGTGYATDMRDNWPPRESEPSAGPGRYGTAVHTERKPQQATIATHYPTGTAPGDDNDIPADGSTMGFPDQTGPAQTLDSPVREKGRQMPDADNISKAAEVADVIAKSGNTFPERGVMNTD